jgi:hypothetical protein
VLLVATQDFLAGGFYGKLGDVVGQRWHNKRIIRTYVVPRNPDTQAQRANRGLFAKATKLAQIAFNINKGGDGWDTATVGEFSLRVGTAMRRLKAGMSDTDALPLYPDGYSPSHTLSDPSFSYDTGTKTFTIRSTDPFDVQGRTFGIVIHCFDAFAGKWEDIEYTHVQTGSPSFSFSWTGDGTHAYPSGSTFTASTEDDSSHGGSSVLFPSFSFTQTVKPSMASAISWGTFSLEMGFLSFSPTSSKVLLGHAAEMEGGIHIFSIPDDDWEDTDFSIFLLGDGSLTAGIELGEEHSARNGTYIFAGDTTLETDAAFITFSWPYKAFIWP